METTKILVNNFGAAVSCMTSNKQIKFLIRLQGGEFRCPAAGTTDTHPESYLSNNPTVSLGDLSYTTTARRQHHRFRFTVAENSIDRVRVALQKGPVPYTDYPGAKQKQQNVAFVFTGQGAAYHSLASELYAHSTQFQADIKQFECIAQQQGYPSFLSLIDGNLTDITSLSTVQVQLGLVCIQVALARLYSSWGIKPSFVIGHSLGEYAALQVAGVLSMNDMIFLVGHRANLLEKRCDRNTHSMLVVAASCAQVSPMPDELAGRVELACVNSPTETVFSGEAQAIDQLEAHIITRQVRCKKLLLRYAFHSSQMDSILDELEEAAQAVMMGTPRISIISAVTGRVLGPDDHVNGAYLRHHCRQPVRFSTALEAAEKSGDLDLSTVAFIELGPHPISSGMIKATLGRNARSLPTLVRDMNPWEVAVKSLARLHDWGLGVNWGEFHREFEKNYCLLYLPRYEFDNQNYWIQYVNDWSLRKGDPLPTSEAGIETQAKPKLTSSVHRVVEKKTGSSTKQTVIYESDLWEPLLHSALCSHRVNGCELSPSSAYADIALTVTNHIVHNSISREICGLVLSDLAIHQPLIIKPAGEDRVLRIYAQQNKETETVQVEYASCSPDLGNRTTHAVCNVHYGTNDKWYKRWLRGFHFIQDRIDALEARVGRGEVSKIGTSVAYRLFKSVVDYAPGYRRMDAILFSSESLEGSATVKLEIQKCDEGFMCSPYWLDSMAHLSGFIMNANPIIDTDEVVYVSRGWESMGLFKPLLPDTRHQTYVKMCHTDKTMVSGDVWVLREGELVGVISGVQFQRVARAVLNVLLPNPIPNQRESMPRVDTSAPGIKGMGTVKPKREMVGKDSVLGVLANHLGIDPSEISYDDVLPEIGLDSLASLTLIASLQKLLGLYISHHQLDGCSTVSQLIDVVLEAQHSSSLVHDSENSSGQICGTPSTSTIYNPTPNSPGNRTVDTIRALIVEETGISGDELDPRTELSELGLDSLMKLTVLGRAREVGLDLPVDFFLKHKNMDDIVHAYCRSGSYSSMESGSGSALDQDLGCQIYEDKPRKDEESAPIVPLQSRRDTPNVRRLFLLPDSAGSPVPYSALGELHHTIEVYGLVCPFINKPDGYPSRLEDTVRHYVTAIRDCQPRGPYYLGGWSAGGILAFEVMKQLHDAGEETRSLIIIDSPCPSTLPPMPPSLIESLKMNGIFDGIASEKCDQLAKNFHAIVDQLSSYQWTSFVASKQAPETLIVHAEDGLSERFEALRLQGGDSPIHRWLLEKRTDFGPLGWENLLPSEKISTVSTGGDHFSMMQPPNVGSCPEIDRIVLVFG
ncbi:hypothetical protein EYZ11_002369 [Aspergillus tanneri]|uniref:Carrier domain-containing protein n=1 Tax=Aspergillus tanneri TaxID=1220188 RepID=A0A4S3JR77_9EURO|nr:hypothetical protein EYZ11_002369 [Aspergillus tanneri]